MIRLSPIRRVHFVVFALVLSCATLIIVSVWRSAASQENENQPSRKASQAQMKQKFYAQMRRGLGSEVRFAGPNASAEDIRASIGSVASFIHGRSDLGMSEQTRTRLMEMEQRTLGGKNRRISFEELTDVLTETALERLSSLNDKEIDYAAEILRNGTNYVTLRASGQNFSKPEKFVEQVKAIRDQISQGDKALQESVRLSVEGELKSKVQLFSEAVPEQFGGALKDGVTPLQAILITYSVVADDNLDSSQVDLDNQTQRAYQEMVAGGRRQSSRPVKAYGVGGLWFSTPLDLVFNQATLMSLLDRIEKRSEQ